MSLATQSSDPPGSSSSSGLSAFKTVGSQLSVSAGAIKPASSPLTRSPVTNRKHTRDSSDQETEEDNDRPVSPSSEDGSAPVTPTPGAAAAADTFSWPSHVQCDENRQLLGTEEESSERQSSEDETSQEREKNIWSITREQLNYYTTQFRSMQPNPHGVIPGAQAKEFFEKSRLPIQELRQIWQLSDVTKDGCLSLEEFLTAMHLVVLRRNEISLPEELPGCLVPSQLRLSVLDRHNKDLYSSDGGHGQEPLLDNSNTSVDTSVDKTAAELSPGSQISSPGAPVKFDFNAASVATDPSIACPKPLRLSPDSPYQHSSDDSREGSPVTVGGRQHSKVKKREVEYETLWNVEDSVTNTSRPSSGSDSSSSDDEEAVSVTEPDSGPVSLPHFSVSSHSTDHSRPAVNVLGLQKKEGLPPLPPSPPPRPGKTHIRSASLDLNKLKDRPAVPSLPPRASPFNKQGDSTASVDIDDSRDNKEISASIHRYKESIALLGRTVQELSQEVNDTVEERVVLEYQLDQLKTIGSSDQLSD